MAGKAKDETGKSNAGKAGAGKGSAGKTGGRKVKLPKEIAGVKLSKELRRSAEALIEEATRPETLKALATGAAAVAGAAMAAKAARNAQGSGAQTPPASPQPGEGGTQAGSGDHLAEMLTAAAMKAMQGFMKPR